MDDAEFRQGDSLPLQGAYRLPPKLRPFSSGKVGFENKSLPTILGAWKVSNHFLAIKLIKPTLQIKQQRVLEANRIVL